MSPVFYWGQWRASYPKKGQLLAVAKDCFCEAYLHEIFSHYRKGLKERKLKKDDIVTFVEDYSNCYGHFARVRDDKGTTYDLKYDNLRQATLEELGGDPDIKEVPQ